MVVSGQWGYHTAVTGIAGGEIGVCGQVMGKIKCWSKVKIGLIEQPTGGKKGRSRTAV